MKTIRFLHIPKTAGTTLTSLLRNEYGRANIFAFTGDVPADIERYRALPAEAREKIRAFTGHAPIVSGLEEADRATMLTLLRSPVSRVRSFCQHVSEGKSPYLVKEVPPETFDLSQFLRSGNDELSNLQTKMLINHSNCESPALINSMSPSDARDLALENLFNRIEVFGLQDYFDESLILFSSRLGWRQYPFYVARNRKDKSRLIEFKPEHMEQIRELNAIDIEVYERAKQRFEEIMRTELPTARLRVFRVLNSLRAVPEELKPTLRSLRRDVRQDRGQ